MAAHICSALQVALVSSLCLILYLAGGAFVFDKISNSKNKKKKRHRYEDLPWIHQSAVTHRLAPRMFSRSSKYNAALDPARALGPI